MCFNHGYYILKFVACGIKEKKGVYLNHLLINVEVFRISSICTADVIAYCGKKKLTFSRYHVMVGSARTKPVAELKSQHARISSSIQGCLNELLV
jgi:hypothetical protein